jgi:hypothetical protein
MVRIVRGVFDLSLQLEKRYEKSFPFGGDDFGVSFSRHSIPADRQGYAYHL